MRTVKAEGWGIGGYGGKRETGRGHEDGGEAHSVGLSTYSYQVPLLLSASCSLQASQYRKDRLLAPHPHSPVWREGVSRLFERTPPAGRLKPQKLQMARPLMCSPGHYPTPPPNQGDIDCKEQGSWSQMVFGSCVSQLYHLLTV